RRRVGHLKRTDHLKAWNAERVPGQVTQQATRFALQLWFPGGGLRQGVEDGALPRVLGGELQRPGAADPADRGGLVEIDRAGILRRDVRGLVAGLREDERLRVGGNLQRVEDRPQVAGVTIEGEPGGALLEPFAQLRD